MPLKVRGGIYNCKLKLYMPLKVFSLYRDGFSGDRFFGNISLRGLIKVSVNGLLKKLFHKYLFSCT